VYRENYENCCHQVIYFKAHSTPPDLLYSIAEFRVLHQRERKGKGERKRDEGKRKEGEEKSGGRE